jgi:hypothetical protein
MLYWWIGKLFIWTNRKNMRRQSLFGKKQQFFIIKYLEGTTQITKVELEQTKLIF